MQRMWKIFDIIEYFEETEIEGQSLAILILDSCDVDHLKELKQLFINLFNIGAL